MRNEYGEANDDRVAGIDPWGLFRIRLAAYISTMIGPVGEESVVLHLPVVEGESAAIRVSVVEEGVGVRVEQLWNPFADQCFAIDDAFDAAGVIADVARSKGRLPDPGLMSVTATGLAKTGIGILGLADRAEVPIEDEYVVPHSPTGADPELSRAVLDHVQTHFDQDAAFDEDGDIFLSVSGTRMWLQADCEQPVLHMNASVVEGVRAKRQADLELNLLNRKLMWIRWIRYGDHIVQRVDVPLEPFNPALLSDMIRIYIDNQREVRHDLADRVGGKVVS